MGYCTKPFFHHGNHGIVMVNDPLNKAFLSIAVSGSLNRW